ncbi:hypothetical protein [Burkholderia sp. RS02]|uniref:hypothetical protein n=1 Tax=unclassified Burkholderia TaxID=2613784 RepID=UPI0032189A4C
MDSFYSISKLEISYLDFQSKTATIYANGKNQVAVMARVRLEDKDGRMVNISEDVVKNALYLCDYNTGYELLQVDGEGGVIYDEGGAQGPEKTRDMLYARTKNEYCNAVRSSELVGYDVAEAEWRDDSVAVMFYLSASEHLDGRVIACGIKTSKGYFDSSKLGTRFSMASGQNFKRPSWVELHTLESIDYSRSDNIIVRDAMWKSFGDLSKVADDVELYHPRTANTHHGISSRAECLVYSKQHKFVRKVIKSRNCALASASTEFNSDVSILDSGTRTYRSCADILWGSWRENETYQNYDISALFIESEKVGTQYADFWLTWGGQHIAYRINKGDNRHCWAKPLTPDAVRINFCNYRIPGDFFFRMNGWDKEGWSNSPLSTVVHVTDNYGNEGDITIKAEDKNWPALLINGHLF